ncbi:hypothetical protein BTUL_0003g00700 [Botrytis tulipae]|uniref:Uncharacterized protein n=1 Tax=Botrytis tulipae TaxID=87230 RepID=A0A4Z1F5I4_9HELO|nr:hypothetical protein BTUL_0003g00700 [Botrytis tulipae]
MSTSSSQTSIDINLDYLEGDCLRHPILTDPAEAIVAARFNHGFDPDLPFLPLCMHSKDRDVTKAPTELSRDETNKGSSFHSEGREWNKDGEVSWAVLSSWCPACSKEYEEELFKGNSRILYIMAMLRRHWIMVGDENRTPRGRAEAMEEFSYMNKLERALGKHMTVNKETMVSAQDRIGAFVSEQQSKIDSGQAYESAYASSRDPENYPMYGPANYPAFNPPFNAKLRIHRQMPLNVPRTTAFTTQQPP